MKSWSEQPRFSQPLRDLRLARASTRQAERQAERERELAEAFERGRIAGEAALRQQLLQQRQELLELQQGILHSLQQAVPQLIQRSEAHLIQLALAAAEKLVAGLPVSSEMVEAAVREGLGQLDDHSGLTIQVHPEDLQLLRQSQSPLLDREANDLRFEAVPELSRGGCRIRTPFGLIDARREVKWQRLQQVLCA